MDKVFNASSEALAAVIFHDIYTYIQYKNNITYFRKLCLRIQRDKYSDNWNLVNPVKELLHFCKDFL